nr:hypothetical protein [uncultured Undibacterium sp.]
MPLAQIMKTHSIFSYHFTNAGNALVDPALNGRDVPRDEIVHPHEFVFIYQEQDVDDSKWVSLTEMIRDRLFRYKLEIVILDNQKKLGQKRIAVVHKDGYQIVQSMLYEGIVGDFNLQHIFEFGFAPILLHHIDLLTALNVLESVMRTDY